MHYSPHSLFKILKKLSEPIQSYEDGSFLGHNGPFVPNKHFLGKIINITFIYLLTNFIVPNLKKIYNRPTVMRMHHFGPEMDQFAQINIFLKTVNKPSSYHSCLSTFQKSKSDINLLMKY